MTYIIIYLSEINLVNFDELTQTDGSHLRVSNDGTKTVLSWDDEENPNPPSFINNLSYYEGPYVNMDIFPIVNGPEWTK